MLISEADRELLREEFARHLEKEVILSFFQGGEKRAWEVTQQILEELQELNDRIELIIYDYERSDSEKEKFGIDKAPAIVVSRADIDYGIRYYGTPAGYEFSSLVGSIIDVSRGETDLQLETVNQLRELNSPLRIQVFVTPQCPHCPRAVQMAHKFAMAGDRITGEMIMATDFIDLSREYGVQAVPYIVVNGGAHIFIGALPEPEFLKNVLKGVS